MKLDLTPTTTITTCTARDHNPPVIRTGLDALPFNHRCPGCGYSLTFAASPTQPSK